MGIDWSNAPEGATHWGPESEEWFGGWYKNVNEEWFYFSVSGWESTEISSGRSIQLIPRQPTPDWSIAPDWATHSLTTGPEWGGCDEDVGTVVFDTVDEDGQGDTYMVASHGWIVLEERPKDPVKRTDNNQIRDYQFSPHRYIDVGEGKSLSAHYDKYIYRVPVTQDDADKGYKDVKLDPYRVSVTCKVNDPALDQCLKKAMRGTDKGHSKREVLEEIISAAQRGIDMLDEDGK